MMVAAVPWRPLVLGLAAALFFTIPAGAQGVDVAQRVEQCGTCHGEDGNSRMEKIPSLAGQPEFFIVNQLFLMREKVRPVEAMTPFVKDLKDEDIIALAKHFAALPAKPSGEKIDPALAERGGTLAGSLRCVSCHLPDLSGTQQMPRLAKQRLDYTIDALKAYRDDKRPGADTIMTAVLLGLSDSDLAALAHYATSR